MQSNIITPRQLRRDAEGAEKFLPSDIALDELEAHTILGLQHKMVLSLPEGAVITKRKATWLVTWKDLKVKSKSLSLACEKLLDAKWQRGGV